VTLTERLYNLRTAIAFELQSSEHQRDPWKVRYHGKLIDALHIELTNVREQRNRIAVRNAMPHIDNFKDQITWMGLSPLQVKEIELHIAPLMVSSEGEDETAKMFDARMLKIEVVQLASGSVNGVAKDVKVVREAADALLKKSSIPAIHAKIAVLEKVRSEQFWEDPHVKSLEEVREELRDLIKFLDGSKAGSATIAVDDVLEDGEEVSEGILDIRTYRQKVVDYLAEHQDLAVVHKIKNLEKVGIDDLHELERILWHELGTKSDYLNTTDIRNLAAFVRSIVGL
jgi:type I restriction enzyme, R subunit